MSQQPTKLFNKALYAKRRNRSAKAFENYDFLHRRAMSDIVDRLESINREFPRALFYGTGKLDQLLSPSCAIGEIVHADLAEKRLAARDYNVVFDEDNSPFSSQSFNLIISLLTLHNANDLVGALAQMRAQLKPDGLLIAVLFGEQTLSNLKSALYTAETTVSGGVTPRVAPFAAIRDLGTCLQRAGFALPVVDLDSVDVSYNQPEKIFTDLRGFGETSILQQTTKPMTRSLFANTLMQFASSGARDKFDLVYLTGWTPHESQQKPLKPGSASASLENAVIRGKSGY